MTRDQIIAALERQEQDSLAYWRAFDTATFFRPIGTSWSPAETVRHLTKSNRPIAGALGMSPWLLRIRFGKSARPSLPFDEFVSRYRKALAEGGGAGRFAPSPRSEPDLETWRRRIMDDFVAGNQELRKALARWTERKLDSVLLPHPLVGHVTVREMVFFALYHQQHHIAVVQGRFTASQS